MLVRPVVQVSVLHIEKYKYLCYYVQNELRREELREGEASSHARGWALLGGELGVGVGELSEG